MRNLTSELTSQISKTNFAHQQGTETKESAYKMPFI